MTNRPPANFQEFLALFEPSNVTKMFDPKQMLEGFKPMAMPAMDLQSTMAKSQKQFDAMVAANQAAAAAYRDLLEKQMQIFAKMTENASQQIKSMGAASGPDATAKQAEIYAQAVERALALMIELSDAARKANEEAFAAIQSEVDKAMADLKRG